MCFDPSEPYLKVAHQIYPTPYHAIYGFAERFKLDHTVIAGMVASANREAQTGSSGAAPAPAPAPVPEVPQEPKTRQKCVLKPKAASRVFGVAADTFVKAEEKKEEPQEKQDKPHEENNDEE